ncbi:MAG: M42 family metallopeptidase [Promethearchaeota archaeon]
MKSKLNLKFLKELTDAFGPSGHEWEVQSIVKGVGSPYAEKILTDRTGSLIFQHGSSGPKIMLAGHIDEIGYVVRSIDKSGFLQLSNLGGVNPAYHLGQEIIIRPFNGGEKIIGIIQKRAGGPREDMMKVAPLDKLLVDIGCNSVEEVKALGIKVGDPAVPYSEFRTMSRIWKNKDEDGNLKEKFVDIAVAKAFDDRIGVFIALEVLRRISEQKIEHPNTIFCASTPQEEVGCRGAKTAAQLIQPDIGFSLDVNISGDIPGMQGIDQKMGGGVVISALDNSLIPNPRLRRFIIDVAEKTKIPWQMGFLNRGGTDAGVMHLTGIGAPSMFFGVATRYVHTHHSMLDLADVENTIKLLIEIIKRLDQTTVESFTRID